MILQELLELHEAKWSGEVKEKWSPEEGFFEKSATAIAKGLKAASKDLKQAMSRLNFYINRAGKNLSAEDKERLESAKEKLHSLYEADELDGLDELMFEGVDGKWRVKWINYPKGNKPKTVDASFFDEDNGFEKKDIKKILKLEVGETLTIDGMDDSVEVTRLN